MGEAAPLVNLETVGSGCGARPDNCRRLPPAPPYAGQGGDDQRKRRGDRTRGRRGDDFARATPDRRRRRVRRRRGDGRCRESRARLRGAPDARAAPRIPHRRRLRRSVWPRGRAQPRGARDTTQPVGGNRRIVSCLSRRPGSSTTGRPTLRARATVRRYGRIPRLSSNSHFGPQRCGEPVAAFLGAPASRRHARGARDNVDAGETPALPGRRVHRHNENRWRLSMQDDRKLSLRYDRGSLRMGADA